MHAGTSHTHLLFQDLRNKESANKLIKINITLKNNQKALIASVGFDSLLGIRYNLYRKLCSNLYS
jgi:hypothetical protein